MIRSDGNSWDTKLIAAGATHAGIIEPTTQYATASIAVYSSAGGTLRIYRGSTADSVILVESMPLPAGGASTFIVPAIESHFQVRLEAGAIYPTLAVTDFQGEDPLPLSPVLPPPPAPIFQVGVASGH